MWLLDGENSLIILLAVSMQRRRVTDGETDRQTSCDSTVRAMHAHREVKISMLFPGCSFEL